MAGEIKVTSKLKLAKGNNAEKIIPAELSYDQTGDGSYSNVHNIGTTEESVAAFGDVSTFGWCYLRNLDTTNYVQWGFATTDYGGRMEAGEPAGPFRLEPGITLYLKANTAACNVRIAVFED